VRAGLRLARAWFKNGEAFSANVEKFGKEVS